MGDIDTKAATEIVLDATGRAPLHDAVAWLAEDHPMKAATDWPRLLRALVVVIEDDDEVGARALRRAVREATASNVDTAKVVFDAANLPRPADFAAALHALLSHSDDGTLAGLTPVAVLRASQVDEHAIETLCLVAGVAYTDACEWFEVGDREWGLSEITQLLEYLDDLVKGAVKPPIPGTIPARAIELVSGSEAGWAAIDRLRVQGVPYELLLAQRAVGGTWLAHKNRTSNFPNTVAADLVCTELTERGIDFRRATTVGGTSKQTDLQNLAGILNKRIGVVCLSKGRATFAVAFSAARNGGTARANGDGLLQIPRHRLPLALVLTGLGWAQRPETDRLARRFNGLLFTDRSIGQLVDSIEEVCR